MTISSAALDLAVEEVLLPPVRDLGGGFKARRALPSAQRRTVGPFIFLDHFGPITFRAGEVPDVRPHPHIGLSTLTYLLEGEMVHRDSAGSLQTIRPGDVNWMTAGRGIVHSERSPVKSKTQGGTMFGQQVWVALPKALEEIEPSFSHHTEGPLPSLQADGASLTVVAGEAFGQRSPVPVYSDLMYIDVVLKPRRTIADPRPAHRACSIHCRGRGRSRGTRRAPSAKPSWWSSSLVPRSCCRPAAAHVTPTGTSSRARRTGSSRRRTTGRVVAFPRSLARPISSRCRPTRHTPSAPALAGWPPPSRQQFEAMCGRQGAFLIGDPATVASKMLDTDRALGGVSRITFQMSTASLETAAMKRSIELLGAEVAPIVHAAGLKHRPPTKKETSYAELF